MIFSRFGPLTWTALAAVCGATPMPLEPLNARQNELVVREAMEAAIHTPHLEKRLSTDFDMVKTWKNEVLFSGNWVNHDGGAAESCSLTVTCLDCYTRGTVTAKLTDEDIFNPTVRLDFRGVEAYVDVEVAMSAGATYAINLFTSNTPIGLGFPGLSVGIVFYVDLVFSLTEEIDLTGGFYVKLADDAFLETSVFGGEITDHFFDGLSSKSLPITVKTGKATFKADLRLRVQCGAEAEFMGTGATAELGVYANLIEFVAVIEKTPTCDLQSMEWWDLNVGAYARLGVVIDYSTIGAIPTVSTTLLSAPTMTQCWIGAGGSPGVPTGISSPPADATSGGFTSTISTTLITAPSITAVPPTTTGGGGGGEGGDSTTISRFTSSYGTGTYKFPLTNSSTPTSTGDDLVTSTLYTTTTYTITSCAASVVNCPASYQQEIIVTQTVDVLTTVCPATAVITATPTPTPEAESAGAVVHVITDVVVLAPCDAPVVETFVPPSSVTPPAVHQITVPVVPAASGSGSGISPTAVAVANFVGKEVYLNGTASIKPSASMTVNTSASKTPVTAGAAGNGRASAIAVVGAVLGLVVLL